MADLIAWSTIVFSFCITYYLIQTRGFPNGAWIPWFAILLLAPAYFEKSLVQSLSIDPRSASACAILLALLVQPIQAGMKPRWLIIDSCFVLFLGSQIVSQILNYELRPLTLPELLRNTGLPYLVGRIFLQSPYDIFPIARLICIPLCLLCGYAFIEAITHHNLLFESFPKFTDRLVDSLLYRWGLKRALATLSHPIYLSLLLAMMLPWTLELFHIWRKKRIPWWAVYMPLIVIGGIISTVSRSGQIAVVIILSSDIFFRFPKIRKPAIACLVGAIFVFFTFRKELVETLESIAGEDATEQYLVIKGEKVLYSGTRHRDLLHLAYKEEVEQSGWFGWGKGLTKMPRDPNLPNMLKSIDDHYLITQLKFGTIGVICFVIFACAGAYCLLKVALDRLHPACGIAGSLFGAFVAVAILVRGVSMETDIGFPWFFIAGIGARLYSMRLEVLDSQQTSTMPNRKQDPA
jgi:hypothetical protein